MSLLALGLNHHTAPVDIREQASIGADRLDDALQALQGIPAVNEAAIVSTCNRTEIYCGLQDDDADPVIEWLHRYHTVNDARFTPYLFTHTDREVVHHLMRVCSGLDSMVLGEPQILGQIKKAYRDADLAGTLGSELSSLFQTAFSVAKQVRTDTAIGNSPVSVAFAAVSLARQIFADFDNHKALLIGAGETVQLAARHLQGANIGQIMIANRTVQRAETLANEVGGVALALNDIPTVLADADIVISSTGSPLPILGKGAVEKAQKARRHRPLLIVDIAVPRDVESQAGELDNVFLYAVDDLRDVIDENLRSRQAAAEQAERIVQQHVEQFMRKLRALGATDTIRAYRQSASDMRTALLSKYQRQLENGQDPSQVLDELAHALTNKLIHTPTARLRRAAEEGDEVMVDSARSLLDPNQTHS